MFKLLRLCRATLMGAFNVKLKAHVKLKATFFALSTLFFSILTLSCQIMPYTDEVSSSGVSDMMLTEQEAFEPLIVQAEQYLLGENRQGDGIKGHGVDEYGVEGGLGDVAEGEKLFNLLCTECHGYRNEPQERALYIINRTQQIPSLERIGEDELALPSSPNYLRATIQKGRSSSVKAHAMPGWRAILSDKEIGDLVAFILSVREDHRLPGGG